MEEKKTKIGMLIGGLSLILFGLALSLFFEKIIFYGFEKELPLKPGSKSFYQWIVTPVPITFSIYFWNWTNPHDIGQNNYTPSFVEMGPYVFREVHEKVNLTWNENGTVTYKVIKRWFFDEEKTNGSLSDQVTSINIVAASVAYITRTWKRFFLYPVSVALVTSGQQLTWTKNVSELLFEGFDNPIQNLGSYVPGNAVEEKFGFFYKKNGTVSSDTYTIGTGKNGLDELGKLEMWNYKNTADTYPTCNKIDGYNGEFWPPERTKEDSLKMYATDMCRAVTFYYEEESSHDGLKTLIYGGTKKTVDNGSLVKENECYCDEDFCPPSGVFDLSKCRFGAPVFMSFPHFYNADPFYSNSMNGMNPDKENHRYYIALEPRTGIQVAVRARFQVNVYLKKNTALSMYRNVKDTFIPVFWMENSVTLGNEHTSAVKAVLGMVEFGPFVYYGLCIIGFLIIVGVALLHLFTHPYFLKRKKNTGNAGSEKGIVTKSEDIQMEVNGHSIKETEYTFSEIKL